MKRIYYDGRITDSIRLDGDVFHYLKNVVRIKEGEEIGILTPEMFAVCFVSELGKRYADLNTLSVRQAKKHAYGLKVYQCLLKREYMDYAIEKYSELGATEIVPVVSERSLNELKDRTLERFTDIAVKAILQSENEQLPIISDSVALSAISADKDENVLFYERCETISMPPVARNMSMVIGPEGGFSDEEYEILVAKGFKPVRPVEQILKAETASIVFTGYVRMIQETL